MWLTKPFKLKPLLDSVSACNEGHLFSVKPVFDPIIPSVIYGCFIAFSAFLQALTVRPVECEVLADIE